MSESCDTCKYRTLPWYKEPCDSCTTNDSGYVPDTDVGDIEVKDEKVQARSADPLDGRTGAE